MLVLFVCKCVLPPGDNPIAVNKYIISYHFSHLLVLLHVNVTQAHTDNYMSRYKHWNVILRPIAVTVRSNTWDCGHSLAGIGGLNPAGGMDVCLLVLRIVR
jgi:hypothetical protein